MCVESDMFFDESRAEVMTMVITFLPSKLDVFVPCFTNRIYKRLWLETFHELVMCTKVNKTIRHLNCFSDLDAAIKVFSGLGIVGEVSIDSFHREGRFFA